MNHGPNPRPTQSTTEMDAGRLTGERWNQNNE
jgi:hypothetical protein